jgi:mannose-6-phosphate isomerase-like protein (cupin superfamily)
MFLETSEESGGARTLIEIELAPDGGNTPHYHLNYDEHFEVLEGALEVQLDEYSRILRPGERAVAYRTVLHRFRNPTNEPTKFLVELRPGHEGFEKAIRVAYGLAGDGMATANGAPKNPYHLALVFEWGEGRLPGIFTLAKPVFDLLAKRARRKGIDRELEDRYLG